MYKLIALLTVSLMAASAQAEIFFCHFNEPFIKVSLDTQTGAVKWTDFARADFATQVDSVMVNDRAVSAAFWNEGTYHRLNMDLTRGGTDGMSNYSYPVRGALVDYMTDRWGFKHDLVGGCYSAERPRVCQYADCN